MHLFEGFTLEIIKLAIPVRINLSFVSWDLEEIVTTFQALLGVLRLKFQAHLGRTFQLDLDDFG